MATKKKATVTKKTIVKPTPSMKFEEIVPELIKLEPGQELVGKLTAISDRDFLDRRTGEVSKGTQYHVKSIDGRDVVFLGDAGFKNMMSLCNIKVNDTFKAEKLEKKLLDNGNEVNDYKIYRATF